MVIRWFEHLLLPSLVLVPIRWKLFKTYENVEYIYAYIHISVVYRGNFYGFLATYFERMKQGQHFVQHIEQSVAAAVLFVAVQFLRLKPLGLLLLEMLQTVEAVVVETH